MSATLTYRRTRKRKDGKATRTVEIGNYTYRTMNPDGTYSTTTIQYRKLGKKENVGGN